MKETTGSKKTLIGTVICFLVLIILVIITFFLSLQDEPEIDVVPLNPRIATEMNRGEETILITLDDVVDGTYQVEIKAKDDQWFVM